MKPFIEFVVQDDHNHSSYEAQLGCYSRYVNNCAKDGDADAVSFKIFDLRAEYDEAIIKRLALNGYSSAARIIDNNFENVTQDVIGDEIETAGTARVMYCERKNVGFRKVARFFSIYSGDKGFFSFEMRPAHTGYVSFYHRYDPYTSAPHVQSVVHILQIRSAMMKTISAYQQPPPENDQECNKDLSWVYESSHVKYPSFSPIVSAGCSPVISSAQGNPEEIAKMNNL
ncbi:MAG: hypothetical protein J3Q66DRAFT_362314 [Benniella sp.]|nr:MAG: hypothetical protein J3Q66DRAFT_362570 [Benniella sp.]KAK3804550.1 MAG: hypothetical protein J3Q66DRAFT_362446 [Benniella sp.]KAK3804570.1 MAG: hypothetical protein J3Q66DRAFT_362314 [Benniella sp.]